MFSQEGLAAATMEQIANEARVGVATVYRHFGDKEHLVRAFAKEMTPKTMLQTLTLLPSEDVKADLKKMLGAALSFCFENRDVLWLVFMGSKSDRLYLASLREQSDSILGYLTNYFKVQLDEERIHSVGKAEELALAFIGMVFVFTVVAPLHYEALLNDPEHISQFIIELFLDDLRKD